MTKEWWEGLSRRQQLRILREMQGATAAAFSLSYLQLERILNGFWDAAARTRKPPEMPF